LKTYTWEEINTMKVQEPDFLINPFIVKEGITFLWGKWGVGKSPTTWWMAKAIGSGTEFFGLPTRKGRVLYLDVDSPETVALNRLKKIQPAPNVLFAIRKPMMFPGQQPEQDRELIDIRKEFKPDLVVFNTLRKCHDLDDKDSKTPKMVYSYYQSLFPKSALLFVHHDKKDSPDPKARVNPTESFSGSQAWINDAQVGLKLTPYHGKRENARIWNIKNQVAPRWPYFQPLPLTLEDDGSNMFSARQQDLEEAVKILGQGHKGVAADALIAHNRGISESHARSARHSVEAGKYPGRGWLEKGHWNTDSEVEL
jgi:hypothetical protein